MSTKKSRAVKKKAPKKIAKSIQAPEIQSRTREVSLPERAITPAAAEPDRIKAEPHFDQVDFTVPSASARSRGWIYAAVFVPILMLLLAMMHFKSSPTPTPAPITSPAPSAIASIIPEPSASPTEVATPIPTASPSPIPHHRHRHHYDGHLICNGGVPVGRDGCTVRQRPHVNFFTSPSMNGAIENAW